MTTASSQSDNMDLETQSETAIEEISRQEVNELKTPRNWKTAGPIVRQSLRNFLDCVEKHKHNEKKYRINFSHRDEITGTWKHMEFSGHILANKYESIVDPGRTKVANYIVSIPFSCRPIVPDDIKRSLFDNIVEDFASSFMYVCKFLTLEQLHQEIWNIIRDTEIRAAEGAQTWIVQDRSCGDLVGDGFFGVSTARIPVTGKLDLPDLIRVVGAFIRHLGHFVVRVIFLTGGSLYSEATSRMTSAELAHQPALLAEELIEFKKMMKQEDRDNIKLYFVEQPRVHGMVVQDGPGNVRWNEFKDLMEAKVDEVESDSIYGGRWIKYIKDLDVHTERFMEVTAPECIMPEWLGYWLRLNHRIKLLEEIKSSSRNLPFTDVRILDDPQGANDLLERVRLASYVLEKEGKKHFQLNQRHLEKFTHLGVPEQIGWEDTRDVTTLKDHLKKDFTDQLSTAYDIWKVVPFKRSNVQIVLPRINLPPRFDRTPWEGDQVLEAILRILTHTSKAFGEGKLEDDRQLQVYLCRPVENEPALKPDWEIIRESWWDPEIVRYWKNRGHMNEQDRTNVMNNLLKGITILEIMCLALALGPEAMLGGIDAMRSESERKVEAGNVTALMLLSVIKKAKKGSHRELITYLHDRPDRVADRTVELVVNPILLYMKQQELVRGTIPSICEMCTKIGVGRLLFEKIISENMFQLLYGRHANREVLSLPFQIRRRLSRLQFNPAYYFEKELTTGAFGAHGVDPEDVCKRYHFEITLPGVGKPVIMGEPPLVEQPFIVRQNFSDPSAFEWISHAMRSGSKKVFLGSKEAAARIKHTALKAMEVIMDRDLPTKDEIDGYRILRHAGQPVTLDQETKNRNQFYHNQRSTIQFAIRQLERIYTSLTGSEDRMPGSVASNPPSSVTSVEVIPKTLPVVAPPVVSRVIISSRKNKPSSQANSGISIPLSAGPSEDRVRANSKRRQSESSDQVQESKKARRVSTRPREHSLVRSAEEEYDPSLPGMDETTSNTRSNASEDSRTRKRRSASPMEFTTRRVDNCKPWKIRETDYPAPEAETSVDKLFDEQSAYLELISGDQGFITRYLNIRDKKRKWLVRMWLRQAKEARDRTNRDTRRGRDQVTRHEIILKAALERMNGDLNQESSYNYFHVLEYWKIEASAMWHIYHKRWHDETTKRRVTALPTMGVGESALSPAISLSVEIENDAPQLRIDEEEEEENNSVSIPSVVASYTDNRERKEPSTSTSVQVQEQAASTSGFDKFMKFCQSQAPAKSSKSIGMPEGLHLSAHGVKTFQKMNRTNSSYVEEESDDDDDDDYGRHPGRSKARKLETEVGQHFDNEGRSLGDVLAQQRPLWSGERLNANFRFEQGFALFKIRSQAIQAWKFKSMCCKKEANLGTFKCEGCNKSTTRMSFGTPFEIMSFNQSLNVGEHSVEKILREAQKHLSPATYLNVFSGLVGAIDIENWQGRLDLRDSETKGPIIECIDKTRQEDSSAPRSWDDNKWKQSLSFPVQVAVMVKASGIEGLVHNLLNEKYIAPLGVSADLLGPMGHAMQKKIERYADQTEESRRAWDYRETISRCRKSQGVRRRRSDESVIVKAWTDLQIDRPFGKYQHKVWGVEKELGGGLHPLLACNGWGYREITQDYNRQRCATRSFGIFTRAQKKMEERGLMSSTNRTVTWLFYGAANDLLSVGMPPKGHSVIDVKEIPALKVAWSLRESGHAPTSADVQAALAGGQAPSLGDIYKFLVPEPERDVNVQEHDAASDVIMTIEVFKRLVVYMCKHAAAFSSVLLVDMKPAGLSEIMESLRYKDTNKIVEKSHRYRQTFWRMYCQEVCEKLRPKCNSAVPTPHFIKN